MEHFDFMGKEELRIAKQWHFERKQKNIQKDNENSRKSFFALLDEATVEINDEYCIADMEPSVDKNGRIYYKAGEKVVCGLTCKQWKKKAIAFAPEYESNIATVYQYVLWIAYRIAMGYWTVEYVCDDSSERGNYWNSPEKSKHFDVSGAKEVGGARDGVGNTYKIVKTKNGFACFGGCYNYNGDDYPVASYIDVVDTCCGILPFGVGVIVLNKVKS